MEKNALKFLLKYMDDKKYLMTISIFLAIMGEIIGLLPYYFIAKVIGSLFNGTFNLKDTILYVGISTGAYIIKYLLTLKSTLISHKISFTILKNIRLNITDKMAKIHMGEILNRSIGEFKNLIVDQVAKLEDSLAHIMPELTSSIIAPMCIIIYIFILNWKMGLVSLITIPIGMLFYLGIFRGYKEKMEKYTKASNNMNSNIVEYINGIKVIKTFSQTGEYYKKLEESVRFFHNSTIEWWRQSWFWNAGAKSVMPSTLLGTLPLGSYLYIMGEIHMEVFVLTIVLPLAFIGPLLKSAVFTEEFSFIGASINTIEKFLNTNELQRPNKNVMLKDTGFQFKNVSFSYDNKRVLNNICFTTNKGEMTAIVGSSGSGKSTIAKLMAGFWDVEEGTIEYGGTNIKSISSNQLMENISYVAQDNFLFDMSILDNIKIGKPDASFEEVKRACEIANCYKFILDLPNGYETIVGEAGGKLSGGERQRITLARAILKDSETIILDEATAYAD
ncbi:MAG: ABC transporter ATP-binding protein, partial [Clostridium sp.]|nr:ABC transporter ATP-binding protein [Clostridium sp.]